ncbi:hypothetical protein BLNAU_14315 [Blattamonas nauphoetae]|uniref:Uncharacterized protein n=1 Tax=Blattamonas nauphoetae TaxID=2049346 RepID=A0ABQ9XKK6_9EUKA|nr:hypothetical protein BLNAU_14315 [Blattamonas nauphoetae]
MTLYINSANEGIVVYKSVEKSKPIFAAPLSFSYGSPEFCSPTTPVHASPPIEQNANPPSYRFLLSAPNTTSQRTHFCMVNEQIEPSSFFTQYPTFYYPFPLPPTQQLRENSHPNKNSSLDVPSSACSTPSPNTNSTADS